MTPPAFPDRASAGPSVNGATRAPPNAPDAARACGASEQVTDLSWLFTAASTNEGDEFLFTCTADSGEAGPLALDDYTYVVQALDCTGDTTPNCANGVQRGAPSAPVEDTFLNSDGSADCPNGVRGTTCLKALPTATLV